MSLKNDRGESLVAILISLSVVSIALLFALTGMNNVVTSNRAVLAPPAICREVAQNVMSAIRSNGVQTRGLYTPIDDTPIRLRDLKERQNTYRPREARRAETNEIGVLEGARWPENLQAVNWRSRALSSRPNEPRYLTNSPLLIQGAMNSLLSIYNARNNEACSNREGTVIGRSGPLSELLAMRVVDNHNVNVSLRIRPFELDTGRILTCRPAPLRLRPQAIEEPPLAQKLGIFDYSNYRSDLGLDVEVFVEVQAENQADNRRPQQTKCSFRDRFQYDRVDSRPAAPIVTQSGSRTTFRLAASTGTGAFFPRSPGTQMVCREQHALYNSDGRVTSRRDWSLWAACNRLEICGRRGTVARIDHGLGIIEMVHPSRSRCSSSIEAQAIDAAGNLSDINPISIGGTPPIRPPPYTPRRDDRNDRRGGYMVGGLEFRSRELAEAVADIGGLRITPIANVRFDAGPRMTPLANAYSTAMSSNLASIGPMQSAQAAVGGAATAAGGAPSGSAVSSANAAAASARSAATSARAAANAAAAAAREAASNSSNLGPVGEAMRVQAESAARAADAAADEAERAAIEAARLAEIARLRELARQREEARRRREEAARR